MEPMMDLGGIGPEFLHSVRNNQAMNWSLALGELCDNSFDAGALNVIIRFSSTEKKTSLVIEDNGDGCEDIEKMLTLGKHLRKTTTKLGRFGVGLKEAACWLWGTLRVETVYRGTRYTALVDWERLSRQPDWKVKKPIAEPDPKGKGTILTFERCERKLPHYENIIRDLSYYFSPALKSGRQIVLYSQKRKPVTCIPWSLPDLEEVVQSTFDISGKSVKLNIGVVKEGLPNDRPGLTVSYGHRVILNTSLGAKDYSVSRVCGTLELGDGWTLSKNKTELLDTEREALEEAIYSLAEPVFKLASKQATAIHNAEIANKINDELKAMFQEPQKAKRNGKQNATETILPVDTGRKHSGASKIQSGNTFLVRLKTTGIKMDWKESSGDSLGEVDLTGNRVFLNANHPRIQQHRDSGNHTALVDNCLWLFSYEATKQPQLVLPVFLRPHNGLKEAVSAILKAQGEEQIQ